MFDTVCHFELSLYILLFFLIFSTIFIFISTTFFLVSSTFNFHLPFRCSFCSSNSTRWLKSSRRSYRIGCYERCSFSFYFLVYVMTFHVFSSTFFYDIIFYDIILRDIICHTIVCDSIICFDTIRCNILFPKTI